MADYTPDEGELLDLQRILIYEDMTLRLYVNKVTQGSSDTSSTFTAAVGGGYADKTLTAANWSTSVVSNVATGTYAEQTFTFTGVLTSPSNKSSCSTTSGDATVVVPNITDLVVGQLVSGTGIPAGAYITELTDSTHIEISANATATGSSLTLTFANQVWGAEG